jgi:hypothetical protein
MSGGLTPPVARWAQRIAALAQTGLTYARDPFDIERYHALQQLAAEMQASLTEQSVAEIAGWYAMEGGYATPKVGVRAIVIDESGGFCSSKSGVTACGVPPVDGPMWAKPLRRWRCARSTKNRGTR